MIKENITKDIIIAMRNKNKKVVDTLRFLKSIIINAEKDNMKCLSDEEILNVIFSYNKKLQRSLSIKDDNFINNIKSEIEIISKYLPNEIIDDDIKKYIDKVLNDTDERNFGKLMKIILKELKNIDGKIISKLLKEKLSIYE